MDPLKIILVEPGHSDDELCWCGPKVERYEYGNVIIHNSLREIIESQETLKLSPDDYRERTD